jgi:tRNA threonylcarbamoyladenosine biosynthesis protein TsaE
MPDAEFSLAAMTSWGESLGARLTPRTVVTLSGDLGAGKTTLAQAICRGYGVHGPVTSPTFALVHEYQAERSVVFHLDLFRLDGPHQLPGIGWDDVVVSDALVLVEWPEHVGAAAPADAMTICLAHVPGVPDKRRVTW